MCVLWGSSIRLAGVWRGTAAELQPKDSVWPRSSQRPPGVCWCVSVRSVYASLSAIWRILDSAHNNKELPPTCLLTPCSSFCFCCLSLGFSLICYFCSPSLMFLFFFAKRLHPIGAMCFTSQPKCLNHRITGMHTYVDMHTRTHWATGVRHF